MERLDNIEQDPLINGMSKIIDGLTDEQKSKLAEIRKAKEVTK